MTPTLRVVLIVVSILTTFMIMRKIRQPRKDTEHNENGRESQPENRILDLEF